MVHRLFPFLTIMLLIDFPAFSTEPDTPQNDPIERKSFEELDISSAERPVRPRGFARNGQVRGAGFRPGEFRDGPFGGDRFSENGLGREFRGFSRRRQNLVYETKFGFAFLDGQLVPPPYRMERRDGKYFLNDLPLDDYLASESAGAENVPVVDLDELYMQLNTDRFAVKFPGRPIFCLEEKCDSKLIPLLLLEKKDRPAEIAAFLKELPSTEDREQWNQWLLQVEVPGPDAERMQKRYEFLKQTKDQSTRFLDAEAVMENYSYPLTLIGMIVVVLAVGYLLAFNPSMAQLLPEQARAAQLSKSVQYSVILIVVMSALDLGWTILSSSVGLMNELNPVGSNLINDPVSLIKFKMAATLLAAGLFLGLRKFRSAQLASWWMCIVCTLVSARWLVFNSLYMG